MNESLSMPTITSTPITESSNLTSAAAAGRPVGMYSTDMSFNQQSQPGSQDQGMFKQMALVVSLHLLKNAGRKVLSCLKY